MLSLREMSGYDIKRSFDHAVHFVWNAADSQIYRELRDMEKHELIVSHLVQQDGKPNKRVYRVTEHGLATLDEWLRSPAEAPFDKEPFLMRLFFMGRIDRDDAIRVLSERRDEIRALLAVASDRLEMYSDLSRTEHPEMLWWQVRLIKGFEHTQTAQLEWIDSLLDELRTQVERDHGTEVPGLMSED
ncbi:PadR family transcriptional regulator [Nocardioides endophyticus]|uniref:PadR family transcriptional regulator n=1 Tax=Nocardioides endophyticus TaxID=1353775 RepID=UPI0031E65A9E